MIWRDYPDTSTPITAAALNDLEQRVHAATTGLDTVREEIGNNFETLTTKVTTVEQRTNSLVASPIGGRITSQPPSNVPLRVVCWNAVAQTNQYGQAILNLPPGVNGIKDCVVSLARFDNEDADAFADVITITGVNANRPIVTITRNGQRRANISTFVQVFGIGW